MKERSLLSEKKTVKEIAKDELYEQKLSPSEYYPFLSGVIRGAGELHFTREGFALEISSPDERLIDSVVAVAEKLFGKRLSKDGSDIDVGYAHTVFYKVVFPQNLSEKVLEEGKIVKNKYDFYDEIPAGFLEKPKEKRAFMKGLYLSCSSIRVPEEKDGKVSSGYTLSFSLNSDQVKSDIKKLIASASKIKEESIREKKTGNGIYIKSSEAICEVLTAMGCVVSPLALYDIIAERQLRNQVNREQNSEMGNLQKSINASMKQIEAINTLKKYGGYDELSMDLKETCEKRLQNPEIDSAKLGQLFEPPITKSCINHRLRKIIERAEKVKKSK